MHDVMYDIQKLKPQGRRELVSYLHYLGTVEGRETSRKKRWICGVGLLGKRTIDAYGMP